ncbi:MAG: F0F1 ATP synthase subunit B [Pseudomonadales bacterium]|jgi:F-type H+-transporting ATPase subunit b|nr:F0F1 ATP synthase subunit B [Pseudomonadales bacterium]
MNLNATIIGQIFAFFLFAWFCQAIVWPPVVRAMEERRKKIADGLDAADRASHDLERAQERVAEQLRDAKANSAGIIDQANKRASQIIEEAKEKAREEAGRIKAGAQAEIDQQVNQAREQLRQQVATLAVAGAEKILERAVDQNAHADLLRKLAASL